MQQAYSLRALLREIYGKPPPKRALAALLQRILQSLQKKEEPMC